MIIKMEQNINLGDIADEIAMKCSNSDIASFIMYILNACQRLEVDEEVLANIYKGVKEIYEVDNEVLDLDHLVKQYCGDE